MAVKLGSVLFSKEMGKSLLVGVTVSDKNLTIFETLGTDIIFKNCVEAPNV